MAMAAVTLPGEVEDKKPLPQGTSSLQRSMLLALEMTRLDT